MWIARACVPTSRPSNIKSSITLVDASKRIYFRTKTLKQYAADHYYSLCGFYEKGTNDLDFSEDYRDWKEA
jgi:hypothetical protein